ncbi:hypothetical protein [Rhodobacter capsulatus]|uniref:hypothetical protein n=1 Tax=Rhodobacter capsulatus TaxID=1061 RepID=UPI0003F7761A|nr:hypothetical protein [Rhodobacter capsulatus]
MSGSAALLKIVRFGMIRVVPGLFNFALIPWLLVTLGPAAYGVYSTWLGYAALVANTVAAIVTQPMFRYLPHRPEERELFTGFALVAALAAAALSGGIFLHLGVSTSFALGFAAFSFGTVLGSSVGVDFVLSQRVMRLASFEALRILSILVVLALPLLRGLPLRTEDVVLGLAVSNLLPILLLAGRPRLALPSRAWLLRTLSYGAKSAAWLLMAGLPMVSAKTILMQAMPEHAFGAYTAVADLTYRGFALANAALMMWAFPLLSAQFDAGEVAETRRTLRFTLLVYSGLGAAAVAVLLGGIDLFRIDAAALPGGMIGVALITLASFGWHGMSIAHKPFEMTQRTMQMAALMALGVAGFYTSSFGLIRLAGFEAFYVVILSLIAVALVYGGIGLSQKLER